MSVMAEILEMAAASADVCPRCGKSGVEVGSYILGYMCDECASGAANDMRKMLDRQTPEAMARTETK